MTVTVTVTMTVTVTVTVTVTAAITTGVCTLCFCCLCVCTCVSVLVRAWALSHFHVRCNPLLRRNFAFWRLSSFRDFLRSRPSRPCWRLGVICLLCVSSSALPQVSVLSCVFVCHPVYTYTLLRTFFKSHFVFFCSYTHFLAVTYMTVTVTLSVKHDCGCDLVCHTRLWLWPCLSHTTVAATLSVTHGCERFAKSNKFHVCDDGAINGRYLPPKRSDYVWQGNLLKWPVRFVLCVGAFIFRTRQLSCPEHTQ